MSTRADVLGCDVVSILILIYSGVVGIGVLFARMFCLTEFRSNYRPAYDYTVDLLTS
jgi:hypothetical protein